MSDKCWYVNNWLIIILIGIFGFYNKRNGLVKKIFLIKSDLANFVIFFLFNFTKKYES